MTTADSGEMESPFVGALAGNGRQAYAVPLHEQLRKVPRDARIEETDSFGTTFYPVGLLCHKASIIIKEFSIREEEKMRESVPKPTSVDPWAGRHDGMRCSTCMWYLGKGGVVGRCRRHAPTMGGYPVVKVMDWCGDHRLDETK